MKAETFEEFQALPQAVQDRVLEKNHGWNVEHFNWWEDVYEQFKEDMQAKGMCVGRMQFSGFWCQGDGASFNGGIDDISLFISSHKYLAEFVELVEHDEKNTFDMGIRASWKSHGSYSHSGTLQHEFDSNLVEPDPNDYDSPLMYQMLRRLHEDLQERADAFALAVETVVEGHCDDLYNRLEEEYDYLTSDESIVENMLVNDSLQEAIDEAVKYLGLEEKDEQQTAKEDLA